MDKILKIVQDLSEIRKIEQYLFIDDISSTSFHDLRHNIYEKKKNLVINELDFVILSPGGQADFAYRIIKNLRNNFEKVNIIVPFWAKSAATLLSFGGSEIIMSEFAEFGPLDAQLPKQKDESPEYERVSALIDELSLKRIEDRAKFLFHEMFVTMYRSKRIPIAKNLLFELLVNYVTKFYEPLLKQLNPEKLGEKKRILDQAVQYANRILLDFHENNDFSKIQSLIDFLVNECPDHGYVIDYSIISKYLDNVKSSKEVSDMYNSKLLELSHILIDKYDDQIDFTYNGFLPIQEDLDTDSSKISSETISNKE